MFPAATYATTIVSILYAHSSAIRIPLSFQYYHQEADEPLPLTAMLAACRGCGNKAIAITGAADLQSMLCVTPVVHDPYHLLPKEPQRRQPNGLSRVDNIMARVLCR